MTNIESVLEQGRGIRVVSRVSWFLSFYLVGIVSIWCKKIGLQGWLRERLMNLIGLKIPAIWYGQGFGLVKLRLVGLGIYKIGRRYHAV